MFQYTQIISLVHKALDVDTWLLLKYHTNKIAYNFNWITMDMTNEQIHA